MNKNQDLSKLYIIDKKMKINQNQNGRIHLDPKENGTPFFIQDKIEKTENTNYSNAVQYMFNPTLLSTTFFSLDNIIILQNAIRSKIHEKTNKKYIIDKQDPDQLKIVMRSIFLQNALHQECNIKEQITTLNDLVLDYCIPKVYGELMGYIKYKEDISTLAVPIDRPVHLSLDKTIEMNRFF